VLTKDVPLRVAGTEGLSGTVASVDSELTLLYRKLEGHTIPVAGSIANSYFLGDASMSAAKPFEHRSYDLYLVARLDGYTVADVKALIDRGASPSTEGVIVLDGKLELSPSPGNKWLTNAAARLKGFPGWSDRVEIDTTLHVLRDRSNLLGYYSWGSNDLAIRTRLLNNRFVNGALAAEYVSTDARTFVEPPADWEINDKRKPFGGSQQSLIGDLIREGITGVAGHVAEPYLNATIRPDILFPAYVAGSNLVESFYLAMPFVSWQTVVIGDPLCAPFRTKKLTATDIDPGVDPATDLPKFFSERRIATLVAGGAKPQSAKLLAEADGRLARRDTRGVRQVLERLTAADDSVLGAELWLGNLYDSSGEWDAAIERYQRIVAKEPDHAAALNNLAYLLATRKQRPADALPLAQRAYSLLRGNAGAADTLAWTYHLLGNDTLAQPLIREAVDIQPCDADLRLHAAAILVALGKTDAASQELATAVQIDEKVRERSEFEEIRKRLTPTK